MPAASAGAAGRALRLAGGLAALGFRDRLCAAVAARETGFDVLVALGFGSREIVPVGATGSSGVAGHTNSPGAATGAALSSSPSANVTAAAVAHPIASAAASRRRPRDCPGRVGPAPSARRSAPRGSAGRRAGRMRGEGAEPSGE
ncbi:hypothetical protein [Actinoplanes aureus]|uniref:hypothetical protein n=1 Tax=Actinoplanes aureus TaxID=2792083 RepID=UPI001E572AB0|nr:hypothetical protein [Actinoplanes aureus]